MKKTDLLTKAECNSQQHVLKAISCKSSRLFFFFVLLKLRENKILEQITNLDVNMLKGIGEVKIGLEFSIVELKA